MNEGSSPCALSSEVSTRITDQLRRTISSSPSLVQDCGELTRAHLAARDVCGVCGGSGEGPVASEQDCEKCRGAGVLPRDLSRLRDQLELWCKDMVLAHTDNALQREILISAIEVVDWTDLAGDYVLKETVSDE